MNWYPIIVGILSGAISVATFQLLPPRLNVWLRGLIAVAVVTVIAVAVRLVFGPF